MKGIAEIHSVGSSAYSTPHCSVLEINSEGVLCYSNYLGGVEHDGIYGEDDPII